MSMLKSKITLKHNLFSAMPACPRFEMVSTYDLPWIQVMNMHNAFLFTADAF
jgi:hypothetical protein